MPQLSLSISNQWPSAFTLNSMVGFIQKLDLFYTKYQRSRLEQEVIKIIRLTALPQATTIEDLDLRSPCWQTEKTLKTSFLQPPVFSSQKMSALYEFEWLDPTHRRGLDLWELKKRFVLEKQSPSRANAKELSPYFWDWLEQQPMVKKLPKIHYVAPEDLPRYRAFFANNHLQLPDVLKNKAIVSKYIFVMDPDGHLYIHPKILQGDNKSAAFYHSSFFAGEAVAAAGFISIDTTTQKIQALTDASGHYRTGSTHFYNVLCTLSDQGVDLSTIDYHSFHLQQSIKKQGLKIPEPLSCQRFFELYEKTMSMP